MGTLARRLCGLAGAGLVGFGGGLLISERSRGEDWGHFAATPLDPSSSKGEEPTWLSEGTSKTSPSRVSQVPNEKY